MWRTAILGYMQFWNSSKDQWIQRLIYVQLRYKSEGMETVSEQIGIGYSICSKIEEDSIDLLVLYVVAEGNIWYCAASRLLSVIYILGWQVTRH